MKGLAPRVADMSLRSKILLTTIPLLAVMFALAAFTNYAYFTDVYEQDVENSVQSWLGVVCGTANQLWGEILDGILEVTSSRTLRSTVDDMADGEYNRLQVQLSLQGLVASMKASSGLVSSAFFLTPDGKVFTGFETMVHDTSSHLLEFGGYPVTGDIAALDATPSPITPEKTVIPVYAAVSFLDGSNYLALSPEGRGADIILVCLVDTGEISNRLNNGRSSYFTSQSALVSDDNSVTLFPSWEKFAASPGTTVLTARTDMAGYSVALAVSDDSWIYRKYTIAVFCLLAALAATVLGAVAMAAVASFLTRPFKNLMRMVDDIKNDRYQMDVTPRHKDETGQLITAINSMHVTIRDQMERIRETEEEKWRLSGQMLAEQINPHFIYNTLETINMEILEGNTDSASRLVVAFAAFLRGTLNKGEDMTTLASEFRQADAYMEIMNMRMNCRVAWSWSLERGLESLMVPKAVLQPLVENSVKHGFDNGSGAAGIIMPSIRAEARRRGGEVVISVADNGKGIDTVAATEAAEGLAGEHVGLGNITRRLRLYFGSAEVSFQSVPYFRNTVTFSFPCDQEGGDARRD